MAVLFICYTPKGLGWSEMRRAICAFLHRAALTACIEYTLRHLCCFQFNVLLATQIDSLFNGWGRGHTYTYVPTQQGWAFLKSPCDIESCPRFNHGMGASVRPPGRPGLFWFCKQNGTVSELALHSGKSWHKHPHPDTEISLGKHSGCISVFFLVSHAPPFTQWNMFTKPCVHQNLLKVGLR